MLRALGVSMGSGASGENLCSLGVGGLGSMGALALYIYNQLPSFITLPKQFCFIQNHPWYQPMDFKCDLNLFNIKLIHF